MWRKKPLHDLRQTPQQPLVAGQVRRVPDHNTPKALELLAVLDNSPQLVTIDVPRACGILTSRRPHEDLDVLVLRGRACPPVPLLEVEALRLVIRERIQPALGIVVELHEHSVQRDIVEDLADILVWEGTLWCSGEVEVLSGLGLRGAASLVHQLAEVFSEYVHSWRGALKVKVESVHHSVSKGSVL